MKFKRCCFAGHNKIFERDVEKKLANEVEKLITEYGVKEFWVGNYGVFDRTAAFVVRQLKNKYDIRLILVIPYVTKEINNNKEYFEKDFDGIFIADVTSSTPDKYKIIKCNEYMVNCSGFLICYVGHNWGGAAITMRYAKRKELKIINLAK